MSSQPGCAGERDPARPSAIDALLSRLSYSSSNRVTLPAHLSPSDDSVDDLVVLASASSVSGQVLVDCSTCERYEGDRGLHDWEILPST